MIFSMFKLFEVTIFKEIIFNYRINQKDLLIVKKLRIILY
jgi:hypothetical protein